MKRKLISFDWAMKKLLRSKANFDILEGFLSELLKEDIQILDILESESNKENLQDKHNQVDLKVKNHKNEIIIIEIQYEREFDYFQRIMFGTSKVITEHLDESDPYAKVIRVISINILYFDLGRGEDYIYHGSTNFQGLHKKDILTLLAGQQKIYNTDKIYKIFPEYYLIKVNSFNDVAKNTLDEWIYFLKNEEIKKDFKAKGLKKAVQKMHVLKLSDQDRAAYEDYQERRHYQVSMFESSYVVGQMEGREEGIEKGRKEGKKEGIIEIALNCLNAGLLDRETIAQMTGLTVQELEALSVNKG